MVHPGGFEPPTARFVAEYSIQLSYGCIGKYFLKILHSIRRHVVAKSEDGASGRIRTSDRSVRSRVLYPAELRMHRKNNLGDNATDLGEYFIRMLADKLIEDGASGRIRTSDRSVRSRVLYPAELRMHCKFLYNTGCQLLTLIPTANTISFTTSIL